MIQKEEAIISKKPISFIESFCVGLLAGGMEPLVNHPLFTLKTRAQSRQPFTLKPSILYKGILQNAASMIPITAIQISFSQGIKSYCFENKEKFSIGEEIFSAAVAGALSAGISCPTEMILTYQGKSEGKFGVLAKQVIRQDAYRLLDGFAMTMLREAKFTIFYAAVPPLLKPTMSAWVEEEWQASLLSKISSGILAAILTQWVDTIKTMQQAAYPKSPLTITGAARKIYGEGHLQGFFKGGFWRGARVVSAITLMSAVKEKAEEGIIHYHDKEAKRSELRA